MKKRIKASLLALTFFVSPVITKGELIFHQIKKGETLTGISNKYYGDSNYYYSLSIFNNLKDPNLILENNYLIIPERKYLDDLRITINTPKKYFPVNLDNKENLNNKYYALKKGDNFNRVFELIYGDMFDYSQLNVLKYELRDALYMHNTIEEPTKLPIGYKIFLLEPYDLVNLVYTYKKEGKVLQRTR